MNPLEQLTLEYIQYTSSIVQNPNLGDNVKTQFLLQMAQALNVLVPLVQNSDEVEQQLAIEKHQQELQMAREKHQMDLQVSQDKHVMAQQQKQSIPS